MEKFINNLINTMTKKVTVFVGLVWGTTVTMAIIAPILWNVDLATVLGIVSTAWGICVTGYFTKSFKENKEEFGDNDIDVEALTEDIMLKVYEIVNNLED